MNTPDFTVLLERRIGLIKETLNAKAKEYATTYDRLSNFKRQALLKGDNPAGALLGNLSKHLVSVISMIDSYGEDKCPTEKEVDEKIGDSINYLILLEAIFKERRKEREYPTK
jgi:hypothetical protein